MSHGAVCPVNILGIDHMDLGMSRNRGIYLDFFLSFVLYLTYMVRHKSTVLYYTVSNTQCSIEMIPCCCNPEVHSVTEQRSAAHPVDTTAILSWLLYKCMQVQCDTDVLMYCPWPIAAGSSRRQCTVQRICNCGSNQLTG